jgi:hypothetical protein
MVSYLVKLGGRVQLQRMLVQSEQFVFILDVI